LLTPSGATLYGYVSTAPDIAPVCPQMSIDGIEPYGNENNKKPLFSKGFKTL